MEIKTKRLTLVPCTQKTFDEAGNYPLFDHVQFSIDKAEVDGNSIGWYVWLARRLEDKKTIGDLGFKGKPTLEGVVEIGYGMSPEVHNKGYATEAVTALIKWAFLQDLVSKITAECHVANGASIRVLEKVGMKRGAERDGMIYWEQVRK